MISAPAQLVDPGALVYDDKRREQQSRYQDAVNRAGFLSDQEKKNWLMLGHSLTTEQLSMGERLLTKEGLRRLRTQQQLERIKPKER
ncbi:hypothetical protein KJ742_07845 [Patescibacteria group bacterium]|nr:hypothetical protein [Patescibacteria group bacterium]MBU1683824.1 hypothetical protein [Patescibacteria group bacterium]